MKKIKQILAFVGIFVLIGLYATTIVMSFLNHPQFFDFLMASIYASVVIPVLLWTYSFIYKLVHKKDETEQ